MNLEILLSCMHQKDLSIVKKSNIKSKVIVINQCDEDNIIIKKNIKMINTKERGLAQSRNLAVKNATADVCLLADDDETFVDNVDDIIINAYDNYKDADIIVFKINNISGKLGNKEKKLKKLDLLKVSSLQISFKRESIIKNNVEFDKCLGAGTPNGAGEENDFLIKCKKKKMKIYYIPISIAEVAQQKSTWFNGYNEEFFYNRGGTTRYILGFWLAFLYGYYFLIFKYRLYRKEISFHKAHINLMRGIFFKKIEY